MAARTVCAALILALTITVGAQATTNVGPHPLVSTPDFLAQRGLIALPSTFELAPPSFFADAGYPGGHGVAYPAPGGIYVLSTLKGVALSEATLHEWLHKVSERTGGFSNEWGDRDYMLTYEEGLIDAVAVDLSVGYWHYLTGRRMGKRDRASTWMSLTYPREALIWRVASVRATDSPARSEAASNWRVSVLAVKLKARPAILQSALAS